MSITDIRSARESRRTPPWNETAEEALLGAMLLSRDAIAIGSEYLHPGDFYKPSHAHICDAILTLTAAGEPANPVTVSGELERAGLLDAVGGPALLTGLMMDAPSSSPGTVAHYARDIEECAQLRRLIATGGAIAELGYDGRGNARGALDEAEAMLFRLTQQRLTDTTASVSDILDLSLDHLERLYEQGQSITGVPTGFVDIDDNLGGLQPGALYVIGARPSMGKTALALNIATHTALDRKTPTYVFSLEMSQLELVKRIVCAEARIDSKRLRNGQLSETDWSKVASVTGPLAEAPLWIDDNPNLTITELAAKARRLKAKVGDLGLIVVDYVQLMTTRGSAENRQVAVAEISRGLKVLARELEVPIVALSQLSRGLESRVDKRPMLADLRESGSIEQDADVVMFIYRDEVYNADSPDRGTAEVIVAKHRNGPTGQVRLAFLEHYTRFGNMARGGIG